MKKTVKYGLLIVILVGAYLAYSNYPRLNIITGFAAKNVCSCTFEAGRDLRSIEEGDNDFSPVSYAKNKINFDEKSVTSSVFGLKPRKAVYKNGIGCILLPEKLTKGKPAYHRPNREFSQSTLPYPYGNGNPKDSAFSTVNYKALQAAVNNAFDNEAEKIKRTRAVVVLYKDQLIA
ncbi:hypothetical protein [Gillisia limnaea]|uniref:hypothetical protein n=1 Tax=Gillisia limnaea TaxID=195907 RepID=UPI0002F7355E